MQHLAETEFWNKLMHGIFGPRNGGAKIIIDAQDAKTGVGKTSGAVALAEVFANAFDYELKPDDLMLSGSQYIERYRDHPGKEQPSVIVLDEIVGAGAGDARRAMSNLNVTLIRAWNMLRTKRVVTLVTVPDWGDVDSNLQKLADYRIFCLKKPIGYFKAYEVRTEFDGSHRSSGPNLRGLGARKGAQRIRFPNLDSVSDPAYQFLSATKNELLERGIFQADELKEEKETPDPDEARKQEKIDIAQRMRDNGETIANIADALDMSTGWVSKYTNNPDKVKANA